MHPWCSPPSLHKRGHTSPPWRSTRSCIRSLSRTLKGFGAEWLVKTLTGKDFTVFSTAFVCLHPILLLLLSRFRDFQTVKGGSFEEGDVHWFPEGQLNVCYNCVDRHIAKRGDKVAIIHEGDEPGNVTKYTYKDLLREVSKVANVMKSYGVQKGDTVAMWV